MAIVCAVSDAIFSRRVLFVAWFDCNKYESTSECLLTVHFVAECWLCVFGGMAPFFPTRESLPLHSPMAMKHSLLFRANARISFRVAFGWFWHFGASGSLLATFGQFNGQVWQQARNLVLWAVFGLPRCFGLPRNSSPGRTNRVNTKGIASRSEKRKTS